MISERRKEKVAMTGVANRACREARRSFYVALAAGWKACEDNAFQTLKHAEEQAAADSEFAALRNPLAEAVTTGRADR
jgi:hypothetical protein